MQLNVFLADENSECKMGGMTFGRRLEIHVPHIVSSWIRNTGSNVNEWEYYLNAELLARVKSIIYQKT